MITERARALTRGIVEPLSRTLGRAGLTPNMLTVIGSALHLGVAWLLADGRLVAGGLALVVTASIDGLDGTLARLTGRASPFGAFLDSTLDRVSEILVFLGLLIYTQQAGLALEGALVLLAITGSLMVSYTRARSEGVGRPTRVGAFGRLERMAVLVLGLVFGWLTPTLWLIAIGSWLTAAHRVYDVHRTCRADELSAGEPASPQTSWGT